MPTLIIEDGTIIAGANCYVNLAYVRTYAGDRGLCLDNDDESVEQQILKATGYLEARRNRYDGRKTDPSNQNLQWPRTNAVIDCNDPVGSNEIPNELKMAQAQLCVEQSSGLSLYPETNEDVGGQITEEKVDVITVKYSDSVSQGSRSRGTIFAAVEVLLNSLFGTGCNGGIVTTVRV